jgi:streptogramin lyase
MGDSCLKGGTVIAAAVLVASSLAFLGCAPPAPSTGETSYRFERMWPTLQQPWYFDSPNSVAVGAHGLVYVADTLNRRILKLTSAGQFVNEWGSSGDGPGQFRGPGGVAVDHSSYVYVTDSSDRIQKFTADGDFILQWGSTGVDAGEFELPWGIATSARGRVYVCDRGNNRIQRFTSEGVYINEWGGQGSEPGMFDEPWDVATDDADNVYVTDKGNYRVQKFTAGGELLTAWGSQGTGDGEFGSEGPLGIAAGSAGIVFVADRRNFRVQEFTSEGQFIRSWPSSPYVTECYLNSDNKYTIYASACQLLSGIAVDDAQTVYVTDDNNGSIKTFGAKGKLLSEWTSQGEGLYQFRFPFGVAIDGSGNVYVTDTANSRVQKYTIEGVFISTWGSFGYGPGEFYGPRGIALDRSDNVYVADWGNHRIQKFSSEGLFLAQWGSEGSAPGEFYAPQGIALDRSDNVYVADRGNHRIQKFDANNTFLSEWGSHGGDPGELQEPSGVAVDASGDIYVSEFWNNRIQKFTSNGEFLLMWGGHGSGPGQFSGPAGIAVRGNNVYVCDAENSRIQVFTSGGKFVEFFGGFGSDPGKLKYSRGLAVDDAGAVYVSDTFNHRVQKFSQVVLKENSRAIVVAGGGPFAGNDLWDATEMCANFAYRALVHQGFTKESVYYLTSNTDLDLDGNGEADDVDDYMTNTNLEYAITKWAVGADSLVVYLVDHGGAEAFRMNGTETLDVATLAGWVDTVDHSIPDTVTIIYDACQSGSFVETLSGPRRIVIASAAEDENAYFLSTGTISFSSFFWTEVFNGYSVLDAFNVAAEAVGQAIGFQSPQLADQSGLAPTTFIGNGTVIDGEAPVIENVSPPQTLIATSSVDLFAEVNDPDGIARAWVVIRPPGFAPPSPGNPIQNLPSVELFPIVQDSPRWAGTFNGITTEGTYQLAVYSRDRIGNTSLPKLTTVTLGNPLRRRAVVLAGGAQSDLNWEAVQESARLAYEALKSQGYSDEDVAFFSPVTFSAGVDGLNDLANLEWSLTAWATADSLDLVVYLTGEGTAESFTVNADETVSAPTLDAWLDTAQDSLQGTLVVIYDASQSGSFLPKLIPPEDAKRIVVASAGPEQIVGQALERGISFSGYFWRRVLNGASVNDAFTHAAIAMEFAANGQGAELDDNGDGVFDAKNDGLLARRTFIGHGILLAGDAPLIGSISDDETLDGETSATITVYDVTSTRSIDRVLAVGTPPDGSLTDSNDAFPSLELNSVGDNSYEGTLDIFDSIGTYTVSVFAIDADGNVSLPAQTQIYQLAT